MKDSVIQQLRASERERLAGERVRTRVRLSGSSGFRSVIGVF